MIQEAGGIIDFDLPPPWVGKETGKISPQIDWYVTDERLPYHEVYEMSHSEPVMKMQGELNQRKGEVIKEARNEGIRPMPIERLLNFLGYDINTPVLGRSEAVNNAAMRRLTAPRPQATPGAATKPATGAAPAPSVAPAEEKNADQNADETPKKKESTAKKKAADEGSGDQ
jgi:hypothetical protein